MSNSSSLSNITICVTRAASQAGGFIGSLTALGARVLALPAIEIVAPDDEGPIEAAILSLESYSWIIFTSINAVERFYYYLAVCGIAEMPAGVKCACVGSSTAASLAQHGVAPALIPVDYKAEGLMAEFDRMANGETESHVGQRVLMPRALKAREILPEHLREMGYEVDVAPVYQTVSATFTPEQINQLTTENEKLDAVTFTSPSTAKNFFEALSKAGIDPAELFQHALAFSIGAVTTKALRELGLDDDRIIESEESTTKSLIEALTLQYSSQQ